MVLLQSYTSGLLQPRLGYSTGTINRKTQTQHNETCLHMIHLSGGATCKLEFLPPNILLDVKHRHHHHSFHSTEDSNTGGYSDSLCLESMLDRLLGRLEGLQYRKQTVSEANACFSTYYNCYFLFEECLPHGKWSIKLHMIKHCAASCDGTVYRESCRPWSTSVQVVQASA